jgi:hypothetical protein
MKLKLKRSNKILASAIEDDKTISYVNTSCRNRNFGGLRYT